MNQLKKILLAMVLFVPFIHGIDEGEGSLHSQTKELSQVTAQSEQKNKSYWTWENGKWILAGAATLGAGALAYLYQDDIIAWFNSLSFQEQKEKIAELQHSIDQDLQDSAHEQAQLKNQNPASQQAISDLEQSITQKQETIARKQSLLELWIQWLSSAQRAQIINPDNQPVNAWGLYTSADQDSLSAQDEAYWADYKRNEREEKLRPKGDIGVVNFVIGAANPVGAVKDKELAIVALNPFLSNHEKADGFYAAAVDVKNRQYNDVKPAIEEAIKKAQEGVKQKHAPYLEKRNELEKEFERLKESKGDIRSFYPKKLEHESSQAATDYHNEFRRTLYIEWTERDKIDQTLTDYDKLARIFNPEALPASITEHI